MWYERESVPEISIWLFVQQFPWGSALGMEEQEVRPEDITIPCSLKCERMKEV